MNGELTQVSPSQAEFYLDACPFDGAQRDLMIQCCQLSRPIYIGTYDHALLCIVGLIPPSLLSNTAYIWCYTSPEVAKHKIAFGRRAKNLVAYLITLYPRIVGHCLDQPSWRWLESLGAKLTGPNTFEIV